MSSISSSVTLAFSNKIPHSLLASVANFLLHHRHALNLYHPHKAHISSHLASCIQACCSCLHPESAPDTFLTLWRPDVWLQPKFFLHCFMPFQARLTLHILQPVLVIAFLHCSLVAPAYFSLHIANLSTFGHWLRIPFIVFLLCSLVAPAYFSLHITNYVYFWRLITNSFHCTS